MRVVGLDLSLTATGMACSVGGGMWTDTIRTKTRGHDRLDYILSNVCEAVRGADLAVIEGLAFDAHDTDRKNAGLNWMVRHALWLKGVPYALIAPATLKQYATGKGSADKDVLLVAGNLHLPPFFVDHEPDDNEVDSAWLAAAGCRWLGQPIDTTPASQWGALQTRQERRKGRTVTVGPHWPDLTNRIAA
jgi:Holliday junction resolvasome RuvABC endonuclease subunit